MAKSEYHPTRDLIEGLIKSCEEHACPDIPNQPTRCKENCPVVQESIEKLGYNLITI